MAGELQPLGYGTLPAAPGVALGTGGFGSGSYGTGGGGGGGGVGGFLGHLFGEGAHVVGQTVTGLANDAINLPAGLWTGGGMLFHHPEELAKLMWENTLTSFRHPLRAPDQTLLNLLAFAPLPGAAFARAGDIASTIGRAGELPEALAGGAEKAVLAGKGPLSDLGYAESIGRGDQYNRIINQATGLPKSVGRQVFDTLLTGIPQEERLLYTPSGEVRHGWMYSKNPSIKAAQKMVDSMYLRFPEGTPPPLWRIIPGFQRGQAGRLQAAAKAAQTIERSSAKKNAAVFIKKWSGITPVENMAARLVGELRTPDLSSALHEAELRSGRGDVNIPETQEQLRLIQEVKDKGWLTLEHGRLPSGVAYVIPRLSESAPAHLREFIADARKLSDEQQAALHASSVLPEPSLLNRLLSPYHQVMYGGRTPPSLKLLTREYNQAKNLGQTERAAALKVRLDSLTKEWAAPEGAAAEARAAAEPAPPGAAETKLEEELTRLRTEGASGSQERAQEIESHIQRLQANRGLGANLEEVPHDMTVEDMRALRRIGNPFYIPYKIVEQPRKGYGFTAFRKAFRFTGKPTLPGRITHASGATRTAEGESRTLLKMGGGRTDVNKLIAENYTEGMRYVTLMRHYRDILASAQDTPAGIPEGHAQLIRDLTHWPAGVMPRENAEQYAKIQDDLREGKISDPEQSDAHAKLFEGIRNWIFPDTGSVLESMRNLGHDITGMFGKEEGQEFRPVPGYKWVDDRSLGYLNQRNPLWSAFESPRVRGLVRAADTINSIQKSMVLYLKPAYAFPNAFGNAFLNVIQQGFMAPFNLARSYKRFSRLKPETIEKIRQMMGGGFTEALKGAPGLPGFVHTVSNALATGYGKLVDDPFRFASFLHEARLSGFKTNDELERLLNDPSLSDQVDRIANRANEEILNYERMGPGEQAIMRRLVFFYPWLKASTRYASYYAKNHPLAAGLTGQTGQMGEDRISRILGNLPSFEEGLIPFTSGNQFGGMPLTGNPGSFAFIQEPADIAKMLLNLVERNPNIDLGAVANLSPVDRGFLTALTAGKISSRKYAASTPIVNRVLHEIFGSNALFGSPSSLYESFTGGPTYPGSIHPGNDALTELLKYLGTGGLTPQPTNVPALNYQWAQEKYPPPYQGG